MTILQDAMRQLLEEHQHYRDKVYEDDMCSCGWGPGDAGNYDDWIEHILSLVSPG